MAAECSVCGAKLGMGRRLSGKTLCETHEAEEKARLAEEAAARAQAQDEYVRTAASLASDPTAASKLPALAQHAGMSDEVRRLAGIEGLRRIVQAALDDAYLSEAEEESLTQAVRALRLTDGDLLEAIGNQASALMIARLNAGRLPTLNNPVIFLKPNEVAHAQIEATLLKEVVKREMRGGYSGFSVPITKGVRYRVGGYRGHSVVVGTEIHPADTGVLCVTSQRVVFKGARQSVECLFAKLVGMNVFDNGIYLHVSNRKTATMVMLPDGHLAAAIINAAMNPGAMKPEAAT